MKKIILDGSLMTDKLAAHEHMARMLDFPAWYGKNLDALWDMLSASGELEIELINAPALLNSLDTYACRLLSCLYEADKENENIRFVVL